MGIQIDHPLDHDDNGNLSIDENGFTLDYDYRNRLVDVNGFASYDYDAFGRRIKKTVSGVTTYFYYDTAGRVVAEYESSTTPELARTFVFGNGIDEVLAMFKHPDPVNTQGQIDDLNEFGEFITAWLCIDPNDTCYNAAYDDNSDCIINYQDYAAFASVWSFPDLTETRYYYLHDALGSVMGITGGKYDRAEDREFYLYSAYGKPDGVSAAGNPYMFTGRRYDPETGLYYYRARYMSPSLGRFISVDPWEYIDGMNLYEYVGGNPTNYVDPFGYSGELSGSSWFDREIQNLFGGIMEFFFGGKTKSAEKTVASDGTVLSSDLQEWEPSGKLGGMLGGSIEAATLRAFDLLEDCPTDCSRMGIEQGAAMTPITDPLARTVTGKTVTGLDCSRLKAALILAVETYPIARAIHSSKIKRLSLNHLGNKSDCMNSCSKSGISKMTAPAKRTTGRTVLGKYPEYIKLSDKLNARSFQIPDDVWNNMTANEQWLANKKFLDRTIARGDNIILSNPVRNIDGVSGSFRKELDYLINKGYEISKDGLRLIRRK